MSASTINISLISAASAKTRTVTLPRDVTVAELQTFAPKYVVFTVAGCTPAAVTKLGDLYDACAKNGVLEVSFARHASMGGGVQIPGCVSVQW